MPVLRKSGIISAINSNPTTGVASANSAVEVYLPPNTSTIGIQVKGTYTGALTLQLKASNSDTWVTVGGTSLINEATGAASANIASATQGAFQADVTGFTNARITALAAVTGAATVYIQPSPGSGVVVLGAPLPAGTNNIGSISAVTPGGSAISVVSTASTNASSQKASAGNLFEISVSNPTATPAYVKLYNKASAPTVGTDVPVLTITAPATSATQQPSANTLTFSQIGKRFPLGIAMAITAGPLAADTAVAVAGVQVHGTYI